MATTLEEKTAKWSDEQKKNMDEIIQESYNLLALNLADHIVRKASKEKIHFFDNVE